jgi:hypothetical protein
MSRATIALMLLVVLTAALQVGGALRAGETPSAPCGACHD